MNKSCSPKIRITRIVQIHFMKSKEIENPQTHIDTGTHQDIQLSNISIYLNNPTLGGNGDLYLLRK
jgi:hypothetical protein